MRHGMSVGGQVDKYEWWMTMKARIKSFIMLFGCLREPTSCLSLATQSWMTSLLLHRSQRDEHEGADIVSNDKRFSSASTATRHMKTFSRLLFLGSAGTEAQQISPTLTAFGDRTLRNGSAALNTHVQDVRSDPGIQVGPAQRPEPDGVAVQARLTSGGMEAR